MGRARRATHPPPTLWPVQARQAAQDALARGEVRGKTYSSPTPLMRMRDESLPNSSAVLLMLGQQAALLRAVYDDVRGGPGPSLAL